LETQNQNNLKKQHRDTLFRLYFKSPENFLHLPTINPNMAFRLFLYYIELLQLRLKLNKISVYSTAKIKDLPMPDYPMKTHSKPQENNA
jgi:hypothetical protein